MASSNIILQWRRFFCFCRSNGSIPSDHIVLPEDKQVRSETLQCRKIKFSPSATASEPCWSFLHICLNVCAGDWLNSIVLFKTGQHRVLRTLRVTQPTAWISPVFSRSVLPSGATYLVTMVSVCLCVCKLSRDTPHLLKGKIFGSRFGLTYVRTKKKIFSSLHLTLHLFISLI